MKGRFKSQITALHGAFFLSHLGQLYKHFIVVLAHGHKLFLFIRTSWIIKCVKLPEKQQVVVCCLTWASPPPSSAASCPAGPLSTRAPPRHPSGLTSPASGPSFLASPRSTSGLRGADSAALGGWGWDNPGLGTQRNRIMLSTISRCSALVHPRTDR